MIWKNSPVSDARVSATTSSARALVVGVLASLTLIVGCDTGAADPETFGLPLEPGPHLLIDRYLIESSSGVTRIIGTPEREASIPNPLINGRERDDNFQPYFTFLREGGRFRAWYNVPFDHFGADQSYLGYLESSDGINWQRPHRVLTTPADGIRFGASVVAMPGGGYALGYNRNGGLRIATSPDGFVWTPLTSSEAVRHDHDISGLTYDPIRKQYIGVISNGRTVDIGSYVYLFSRNTALSVSKDLRTWDEPRDVLYPDTVDERAIEFYTMDGFITRGNLMIAMVRVLRDNQDADAEERVGMSDRGIGFTSLAWSRDGRRWVRDKAAFFRADPRKGTWDHAMAWIGSQVPVGDSVYLYYAGYETGHKGDKYTERQIGLVRMPRDRYAGFGAGSAGGVLTTRPLRIEGRTLTLNVDAPAGQVETRVLDVDGGVLATCDPVQGDLLDAPLRCTRDLSSFGEPVRLELTLRDATVYAWSVVE